MKVTVTNHVEQKKKAGYAGTVAHNRHDPDVEADNLDIDYDMSEYNYLNQGKDRRESLARWQEEKFGKWIDDHDRQQREKGHGERQYGSVKNWLRPQNKPIGVLTIGSLESTNELMRKVIPEDLLTTRELPNGAEKVSIKTDTPEGKAAAKKFYGVYHAAYQDFVAKANALLGSRKNAGQYIGRYAIHCDELGAPHMHYELGVYSFTAKGKGSGSFDRAMRQMTGKSGKSAMATYRKATDKVMLDSFNTALHQAYGADVTLELTRKTKEDPTVQTGLSMEQVKAIHAEEAKAKAKKDKLDKEISVKEQEKEQLTTEVEDKKYIAKGLDKQISAKTSEVEAKQAEAGELDKTIKHKRKQKDEVETEVASLKAEADLQDKAVTAAEANHNNLMTWWESEEEELKARHDGLLTENRSLEDLNEQLRDNVDTLKTAVDQQSSLFDQITNRLGEWIKDHLKDLINLGLNADGGRQWLKEQGTYTAQESFKADQADDIDRLSVGEEVPRRYVYNDQFKRWMRFTFQRKQRNLRERTGANGTDYSRHDNGPSL
ncbi:hypothetical protein ACXVRB_09975 (plasmid) [Limosilactobacillus ingluviei]